MVDHSTSNILITHPPTSCKACIFLNDTCLQKTWDKISFVNVWSYWDLNRSFVYLRACLHGGLEVPPILHRSPMRRDLAIGMSWERKKTWELWWAFVVGATVPGHSHLTVTHGFSNPVSPWSCGCEQFSMIGPNMIPFFVSDADNTSHMGRGNLIKRVENGGTMLSPIRKCCYKVQSIKNWRFWGNICLTFGGLS